MPSALKVKLNLIEDICNNCLNLSRYRLSIDIEPIWYLVHMLQAFQVSKFHSFWHTKPHDPIKSLNCRINGCLKAIYFVRKDTKWVL